MKFFNLDCHVSVIADLKQIFENLGHEVTSWSISGHNWIFNREKSQVDIINENTWMNLNDDVCGRFYQRYKDELSTYDAFICTYPISFAQLYKNFNKPIILHIPIRYEVPYHRDKIKWEKFNEYLRQGVDTKKIIPVANSEYDEKYFEFFVNRKCDMIPNICEYTNTKWKPSKKQFLYSGRLPIKFDTDFIVDKSTLGRYKWEDLSEFLGIIVIPYTCSTMSIFEHYTSNIPLFFPSKDFMIELYVDYGNFVLSEITWNRVFKFPPGSIIDCEIQNDPNAYDNIEIVKKWIIHSDFYNETSMPFITYFDSFDDLVYKLKNTNLHEISDKMRIFNQSKKQEIYNKWEKILNNL